MSQEKLKMQSLRWTQMALWPALVTALIVGPAPFFGGCAFIKKPEPEATPTPVPEVFKNPNDFLPAVIAPVADSMLNDSTGKDTTIPAYFSLGPVDAGDLLTLQGMRMVGATEVPQGKPLKVKLAGVFCPAPSQPGWAEAKGAASAWLSGRKLNVEQDAKFKITLDGRKVVQITIDGTKKLAGQTLSFNQLLVRSGYAWVDLTTVSSFDYKLWVADEEYARGIRVALTKEDKERAEKAFADTSKAHPVPTLTPTPKPMPMGLWAKNIRPPFRKSPPGMPGGPANGEEIAVPTVPPASTTTGTAGSGSSGSSSGSSSSGSSSFGSSSSSSSSSGSPTGSPTGSATGNPTGSPTGSSGGNSPGHVVN